MRQVASILGSALFLVVAPGTVAVLFRGGSPPGVKRSACCSRWGFGLGFGWSLPLRLSATAARTRSCRAATLILSPSWMSMARPTFPSRLGLNRPEGSFNAAPLANVILTTFLYVCPVQTIPSWEKTGVPVRGLHPLPLFDDLRV